MTKNRKSAQIREKELRLAIMRINHRRSRTGVTKVSITSVAREAGVSPALIHNHYPRIAHAIRHEQAPARSAQGRAKQGKLRRERDKARELRRQLAELRVQMAQLVSINEVLLAENETLRERFGGRVVSLKPTNPIPAPLGVGRAD